MSVCHSVGCFCNSYHCRSSLLWPRETFPCLVYYGNTVKHYNTKMVDWCLKYGIVLSLNHKSDRILWKICINLHLHRLATQYWCQNVMTWCHYNYYNQYFIFFLQEQNAASSQPGVLLTYKQSSHSEHVLNLSWVIQRRQRQGRLPVYDLRLPRDVWLIESSSQRTNFFAKKCCLQFGERSDRMGFDSEWASWVTSSIFHSFLSNHSTANNKNKFLRGHLYHVIEDMVLPDLLP